MYTASKPTALAIQWLAWLWVRTVGPRLLPGPRTSIDRQYYLDILAAAELQLGPRVDISSYRRRDSVRSGETFVATGDGSIVVKVRPDPVALAAEQQILSRIAAKSPKTFSVPRPLGFGVLPDGSGWSAQQMVFSTPHRPCTLLSPDFLAELADVLADALVDQPTSDLGWRPAHGDLTPWNVRRDVRGSLWVFDWEDAGMAPAGTDEAYFGAALGVIRPRSPMPHVTDEVAILLRQRIQNRMAEGHPREPNQIMLDRLRTGFRP